MTEVAAGLKGAPSTAAGGFGMTQVPFAALGGCFNSGRVARFFAPWSAGPKPAAVRFPSCGWASGVLTREKTAAGAATARPGAVEIPPVQSHQSCSGLQEGSEGKAVSVTQNSPSLGEVSHQSKE